MSPRFFFLSYPPLLLFVALQGAFLLSLGRARAALPSDDAGSPATLQNEERQVAMDTPVHRHGSLAVGLQASGSWLDGGGRSLELMLVASVPLARFGGRSASPVWRGASIAERVPTASPSGARRRRQGHASTATLEGLQRDDGAEHEHAVTTTSFRPPLVTPQLARATVEAALRRARLSDVEGPLDALGARARAAALLPELRLRVARELAEEQRFAPTASDPERMTARGGASFWLEARAMWRLDRVVFSDDEVALERLRRERAESQRKLIERVLDLLFTWQRARTRVASSLGTSPEHLDATLAAIEAEAALDVLTDGWFSRQRTHEP
ncbi:hypothetical protein [Chondromyces crocatus]|uniref:Uncharacterized protein n=1 Tax=Chondromyces crocatus TaxID=52 RepID=A0A0K1EQ75_CHOCO|nr:hypothetical protein [Chondromyces crocatus]AKT42807.1 uncharacterized protein CMC5_070340 [Chondromyces crocatus]